MVDWTKICRLAATNRHTRQLPVGLVVHVDVIVLDAVSMRRDKGRWCVLVHPEEATDPHPTLSFSFVLSSRLVPFYLPSHDMKGTESLRPISPQIESG